MTALSLVLVAAFSTCFQIDVHEPIEANDSKDKPAARVLFQSMCRDFLTDLCDSSHLLLAAGACGLSFLPNWLELMQKHF